MFVRGAGMLHFNANCSEEIVHGVKLTNIKRRQTASV